jgi:hypothetical protein
MMIARAWTTIVLWLSTLTFAAWLMTTLTTLSQRQVGSYTAELPGAFGELIPTEMPMYEWFTEYAPDSYTLIVLSIILLLVVVNLLATYFVWRGAINVPAQAETPTAARSSAMSRRRIPDTKAKRSTPDERFTALDEDTDDEYVTPGDGEFMTLDELQRRQRG